MIASVGHLHKKQLQLQKGTKSSVALDVKLLAYLKYLTFNDAHQVQKLSELFYLKYNRLPFFLLLFEM